MEDQMKLLLLEQFHLLQWQQHLAQNVHTLVTEVQ